MQQKGKRIVKKKKKKGATKKKIRKKNRKQIVEEGWGQLTRQRKQKEAKRIRKKK